MKKITVNENVSISEIIFGGTKRGTPEADALQFAIMDRFYEAGGTTFDTARVYGNGECDKSLGEWMKTRGIKRDTVTTCLKGSHPERNTMFVSRLSPDEIVKDIDDSLRDVGIDYTDIYILHRDDIRLPVNDIMYTLDKQVKAGKIGAIGTSNWTAGRINAANIFAKENGLTPFSISQTSFSLAQTTAMLIKDITQVPMNDIEFGWYKETGMPVMCFGAISNGFFSRYASGKEQRPGVLAKYGYLPENWRRAERVKQLALEIGQPVAAVLAAYVRDCGINGAALCGFSDMSQLEEALLATTFTLTCDQIRFLRDTL